MKVVTQTVHCAAVDSVPFHNLLNKVNYSLYSTQRNIGTFPSPSYFSEEKTYKSKVLFCIGRVERNLRSYVDFFALFGYQLPDYSDSNSYEKEKKALTTTFMLWLCLDLTDRLEDYLKFHTAWLFAYVNQQDDLPDSSWSQPGVFMTGPFTRYLRKLTLRKDRQFLLRCFYTLMQWKRGCVPLKVNNIVDNAVKHAKLMTSSFTTPDSILATLERVSTKIGNQLGREMEKGFKIPAPSTRACYERSINDGGSRGFISETIAKPLTEHIGRFEDTLYVKKTDIQFEESEMDKDVNNTIYYNPLTHVRAQVDVELSTCDPKFIFKTIESELYRKQEAKEKYCAKVVAIPEPFKVRIITKSEALLNYYGKPYQKAIHKLLRKTSWALPIGQPITTELIKSRFGVGLVKAGWKMVSGDYASATDRLNSDASIRCLKIILDQGGIATTAKSILLQTLVGQYLEYSELIEGYKSEPQFKEAKARLFKSISALMDEGDVVLTPSVQQTNGQLMGSILSFPILCIINAALFLHSVIEWIEQSQEGQALYPDLTSWDIDLDFCVREFGLLINGDDILFMGPQSLIDIWYQFVPQVGLIPSLGKNYVSEYFFTINSQLYHRAPLTGDVTYIPFVNAGLIYASDPSISSSEIASSALLFATAAEGVQKRVLHGFENDVDFLSLINTLFVRRSHSALKAGSFGRNWFIQKQLGGLGLQHTKNYLVTRKQGRIAAFLATRSSPEQVLKLKLNSSPKDIRQLLSLTTIQAQSVANGILSTVPIIFGGNDPSQIMTEALAIDPYNNETLDIDLSGKKILEKRISQFHIGIVKTLNKCNTEAGSLEPMTLQAILDFDRSDPGILPIVSVTSTLEREYYATSTSEFSIHYQELLDFIENL